MRRVVASKRPSIRYGALNPCPMCGGVLCVCLATVAYTRRRMSNKAGEAAGQKRKSTIATSPETPPPTRCKTSEDQDERKVSSMDSVKVKLTNLKAKAPSSDQQRGGTNSVSPEDMSADYSEKEKAFMLALSELKNKEEEEALSLKNIVNRDREIQTREAELFGALTALDRAKAESNLRLTRHEEKLTTLRVKRGAIEKELGELRSEYQINQAVKVNGLERTCDAQTARISELEAKLARSELLSAQNLEAEREKRTCQICMTNSRNALVMPCMHFLYCSDCLHTHQKTSKECPTCRGPICALIHCKLNLDE